MKLLPVAHQTQFHVKLIETEKDPELVSTYAKDKELI